ncbi:MAG: hypothetical protein JKY50_06885 [Oleispira sp.]|nr:hypothetical protein [Oleispira sp.]MBL4881976.1 hypothetical protein [Oleispira sp.]
MNQIKLVLSSLVLVVLAACGGESDSDSADAEFLTLSAELNSTLPPVNESLSSQSPEGIWRVARHTVLNSKGGAFNESMQEISGFLDVRSESYSQLLIIIEKDFTAENAYIIYTCDGYWGAKSWELEGNTLSYGNINDNIFSPEDDGDFVLENNLRLAGQTRYEYHDSNNDHSENTTYTGVKISDSINFNEAQNLNIDLQINQRDTSYQLSDYVINPGCFSISQDEGELKEYTLATDSTETYSQSSSSFVIEMMGGDRISADEGAIVIDSETSVDLSGYYSNVNGQNLQLFYCSEDSEAPDEECLKSFEMTTSAETNAMSASSKGESLDGETVEIYFSYSQE